MGKPATAAELSWCAQYEHDDVDISYDADVGMMLSAAARCLKTAADERLADFEKLWKSPSYGEVDAKQVDIAKSTLFERNLSAVATGLGLLATVAVCALFYKNPRY